MFDNPHDGRVRSGPQGLLSRALRYRPSLNRASAARCGRWAAVIGLVAVVALSASSAVASTEKSGATVGDLLTLARSSTGQLDPARNDPGQGWFTSLAYDQLIYKTRDDKFAPGLATKWQFIGKGNLLFEITLRRGLRFSDGSNLTAEVLRRSLLRFRNAGGPVANYATFTSIDVTGPLTVRLHLSRPNALLPEYLTRMMGSAIVCPRALENPSMLQTQTCGVGRYVLDPSETVIGDHYTYTANPNYWNKSAVHYRKIVIRIIPNPDAVLAALQTGQIDFAEGGATTLPAARRAGLKVAGYPILWHGINLADRRGRVAPPLRDLRVRQALQYAIDRKAITKALYASIGEPTALLTAPGADGYSPRFNSRYPYDVAKAKQLLKQAGYDNGFTVKLLSCPCANLDLLAQAIASYWAKVGVTLEIDSRVGAAYGVGLNSTGFPAQMMVGANYNIGINGPALYLPDAARNPFQTKDFKLISWYANSMSAPRENTLKLWRAIHERLLDLSWFVPVVRVKLIYYARPTVAGLETGPGQPFIDAIRLYPAGK